MATMSLQATYDQARSYLEANQVEPAIGVAQHILEHFPENLEAHRILGEAYLASRQFDQAETAFSRVLRADPENIPAHVGLGITFERQGKLDRAVTEFEQALEVRPDMPELRGQLLRLYTDLWGAEGATLRLSRPGLARLYAKGHMLPQAIQEFRSVIEEHPERFDARVGLAEALWRDSQEEAATEVCAQILGAHADVLKANLLLGYIKLASSDQSGEPYWRHAQMLDPYQQVAHSLFEALPDLPPPDLNIPTWDEAAWKEQQARSAAPPLPAVAADEPRFSELLEQFEQAPAQSSVSRPTTPPTPQNNDFLASLLDLDTPPVPVDVGSDLDSSSGVTPFSFDFDDLEPTAPQPVAPIETAEQSDQPTSQSATPEAPADVEELTAFSLADLGLSEEEIAQLTPLDEALPGAPAPVGVPELSPPEPVIDLEPFSLADLGLSPDEVAQLNSGAVASSEAPTLEPFSFDDLGLDADEIAQLEAAQKPAATPSSDEPALEPFSFDDLGLDADEIAQLEAAQKPAAAPSSDEPALEPFSLTDLGLNADEIAAFETAQKPEPIPSNAEPALDPFSLADLGLSDEEIAQLEAAQAPASATLGAPSLEPFSLDDLDLNPAGLGATDAASTERQPSPETGMGQLEPFNWGDAQAEEAAHEENDYASDADLSDLEPFSLDDLDLNALGDEDGVGSLPPSLQPFSLDESSSAPSSFQPPPIDNEELPETGGYSWQQPAAKGQTDFLRAKAAEAAQGSIFGRLKQRASERPPEEPTPLLPVSDDDTDGDAYFSNDEVSLRDEEARLPERFAGGFRLPKEGGEPTEPAPPEPVAAQPSPERAPTSEDATLSPFSLEDLGLSPDEIAQLQAANAPLAAAAPTNEESELAPFSLEDLGLSPDEIAQLQAANAPQAAPAPTSEEPELAPFSLEDLGLSGDEIDQLQAVETTPAAPAPTSEEPELSPFSLEDLGLSGDEIAQLQAVEAPPATPAPTSDEPELAPFSLEDLGLNPDEIAQLQAVETPPAAPAAPASTSEEEAELSPFSLEDLGLSPDEIAQLQAVEAPPAAPTSEEPKLSPFSLEDLGLSPEEMAKLEAAGRGEAPFPATGETIVPGWSKGEEPELTPFSFDEIGATPVAGPPAAEVEPFSIDDFNFDAGSAQTEASALEASGIDASVGDVQPFSFDDFDFDAAPDAAGGTVDQSMGSDVQPFSLDDLGLGDLDAPDAASRELGLTAEELANMDMGDFETMIGDAPRSGPLVSDDPEAAMERLMSLGKQQGFVDLTDIISLVTDPEAEADRIEEMGWALHHAGIEIRDGDEVIDMEGEEEEEEVQEATGEAEAEPMAPATTIQMPTAAAPAQEEEAVLAPFSLADLGLSPEEIASLGLPEATSPTAEVAPPSADEPDLTPFSLEDFGLSPDEIAQLKAAESNLSAPAPSEVAGAVATPATPEEPELAPFSLEDLGLSPEEIDQFKDVVSTPEPAAEVPSAIEAKPVASAPVIEEKPIPPAPVIEEKPIPPAPVSEEKPVTPAPAAAPAVQSTEEPVLAPFSLSDLGLSPEEIALLEGTVAAAPKEEPTSEDEFDFGIADEQPVEKVTKRTEPRVEEPPPPVEPADTSFTPEDLDSLDDIWQLADTPPAPPEPVATSAAADTSPAKAESTTPARVVLPPLSERRREPLPPAVPRAPSSQSGSLSRDNERFARREAAQQGRGRREAMLWREGSAEPSAPATREFAGFLPTGEATLDEYLNQLDNEPTNYGLALAVGHMTAQTGRHEIMALAFKRLIKAGEGVDQLAEELEGLLAATDDPSAKQQLYKLLGDTYSKQGRYREAMTAYGTTFGR